MGELETRELDLLRLVTGQRAVLEVPVVQSPVRVELERADRVRHALDRVGLPVRPVVRGVDAPLVTGVVVVAEADPVHHRVAHLHVLVLHVDLRAEHLRALGELARPHPAEQVEVLLGGPVAVGGLDARLAVPTALRRDGLDVRVVHVGETGRHEVLGPFVQGREVVGRVQHGSRLVPEPLDVRDDRVDVLDVLGVRVGVVETQVAQPAEVLGDAEVDRDGLRVADVEVAIGLRWEPRLHPTAVRPLLVVARHGVTDEVGRGNGLSHRGKTSAAGDVARCPSRPPAHPALWRWMSPGSSSLQLRSQRAHPTLALVLLALG